MSNGNVNGNDLTSNNLANQFEGLESRVMMSGSPASTDSAIAYDAKGNLHVAYYDAAAHNLKYTVQSAASGTWSAPVVVDKGSKNVGTQVSLALDKTGLPGIAYRDEANKDLKYAHFDGKKWTVSTVDAKQNTGVNPSLAYDKQNHALISYYRPSAKDLQLAQLNGKIWTFTTIASNATASANSSVALNPATGKPSVAFTGTDGKVRYVEQQGKAFTKPVVVDTIKGGSDLSLTFGPNKQPAFSYTDPETGEVKLATKSGKGFAVTSVGTVDPGQDAGAKVVIDPATGKPQVVFTDPSTGEVFVATKDGDVTLVGDGAGSGTSIVIDPKTGKLIFTKLSNDGTPDVHDTRVVPNAPEDVEAEAISPTRVDVSWSDKSDNETGFLVERSADGGGTFTVVATTSAGATSYSDLTAVEGADYIYRVTAVGKTGEKTSSDETADVTTDLIAPTNLTATSVSAGLVNLAWADNSTRETGYVIERSSDNGSTWTQVGTTSAGANAFVDSTVAAGAQYAYRVKAAGSVSSSDYATSSAARVIPAAPTVTATTASTTRVNLAWSAVNGAASYVIERSTDGGATFTTLVTVNTPGYADTSAVEGSSYQYRVRAINAGGASANSNSANATTFLAVPSGLTATPASATQVDLAWADNSNGETGFRIERSADGGATFTVISTAAANATTFSDTNVAEGTAYVYRVRGFKSVVDSDYSSTVSAMTPMVAPDSLTATAASLTQIDLAWNDNSSSETGYEIYRSTNSGTTWTLIHTAAAGATSYSDTDAAEGSSYQYKVRAVNPTTASAHSSAQSVTTKPAAPSGLGATVASATQINLSWADNSGGETGYRVERSTNGGTSWNTLVTLSAGSTSHNDTAVTEGASYSYRVIATNVAGDSVASSPVTAVALVNGPTSFAASFTTATNVHLMWTNNSSNELGYIVERSDNGGTTFVAVSSLLSPGTASFDDVNVSAGTSYVYRVLAVNSASATTASGNQTILTLPAAATGVSAAVVSATSVTVTWTAVTGAASYAVERSDDGGTTWTSLGAAFTNTYNDTAATEGGTFLYRVTSHNATGDGDVSTASSAVTTVPAAPTGFTATPVSATQVDLAWTDHSSHEIGFIIQRSADNGTTWTTIHTTAADVEAYSDTSVSGGTSCQYRVRASGSSGDSTNTTPQAVLTVPAAPATAIAIASADTHVSLSWTPVTGATGYTIDRSSNGGSTWTTVTSVGNVLTYADSSATEATSYVYRVRATNTTGAGDNSPDAAVTTLPAAAANLTKTVVSATRIDLAWSDNSNGETGYLIERSSNDGVNYTPLIVLAAGSTSYSDAAAAEGTAYVYRVKPVNITGTGAGVTVNATTIPATPTSLVATPVSATQVDLTWADNSTRETGYAVERSSDSGATWTTVTTTAASATSYSDTSVIGGNSYQYRIHAIGAGGNSADSNVQAVLAVPTAVADLAATVVSSTQINLTWTDVAGETGYTLERSDDAGATWTTIATPAAGSISYNDTGRSEGTAYTYRLTSANGTGTSAASNLPAATTLPSAVDTLAATPISATRIDLAWNTNSAHEDGFSIDRSSDGGTTWTTIFTTAAGATTYSDTGVTGGNTYTYRVRAAQGSAFSADSNTPSALTVPAAPANVVATVASDTQVDLTWDAAHGADSYLVEVSSDGGSTWNTVGTPTANSIGHTGATEATNYVYRVTAIDTTGNSIAGSSNAVMTLAAAVTNVAATAVNAGEIDIVWDDNSNGESGFRVERSTDGTTWTTVQTVGIGVTSWNDTTVSAGTTYYYRVFALDATGDSAVSNVDSDLTHPPQVTGLAATPVNTTQIDLAWTAVTGATNYLIEASTNGGATWSTVTTVGAVSSYSHTAATEATAYLYRVTASNATGSGVTSATQAATTYAAAPTGLTVTPVSATQVDLSWTDHSDGETSFIIQRSGDGGTTWTTVHTNAADDLDWSDTTVTGGDTFEYRVVAHNATGDSSAANAAAVLTIPDAVTGFTPTTVSQTAIDLNWAAVHGATGYTIDVSTDSGSTWSSVAIVLDGTTTTYNVTGLTEGTSYLYRIVANDNTGSSADATTTGTTLAAGATSLTATATSNANVDLTWVDNSDGETGFYIERSSDGGETWSLIHTAAADAVSYSDNGISGGYTFIYRVTAFNDAGDAARSNSASALTHPDQVGGLVATPVSASAVDVTWTGVTGATLYTIRRSTDGGTTWTTAGTSTTTTFQDTGRAEATLYTYDVIASNGTGAGADSADQSATTMPAAASALAAAGANTTTINLTWSDNSLGESGYKIERSTDGGTTWTLVHTTAADVTTWADTTATEGSAYLYQIRAYNASGNSDSSNQAAGNSASAAPTVPTATPTSATSVTVTWADNSSGEDGYVVERSADGGTTWVTAGTTLASVTTFNDTSAPEGTPLQYRVHAFKGSVNSTDSPVAFATTVSATPTNLAATAVAATQVDIAWDDNSASETGYDIYRSADGGTTWTKVHTAAADIESWSDTAAPEDKALKYKVVATGAGGDSLASNVADATTPIAAPTSLTATATSNTTVDLAWTDNSSVETGYKIERSTDGGTTWTLIHTTTANATTWSDTTGVENTTYTYRVTATDGTVDSAASNTPSAKTALTAPVVTGVNSDTATQVTLTWSDNSNAETGYQVERSDDGGTTWTLVHTTAADVTTWTDSGLGEGTQHKYRVRAANGSNFSAYTAVSTITTIPATPTTVVASPFSTTQIDITWADNSTHETGYVIERSTDGGTTWTNIHTSAADATSWSDTTAVEAHDYQYRVRATSAAGDSLDSAASVATTAPNAPSTLVATVVSAGQVDLTWADNSNGETVYYIERSTDGGTTFSPLVTINSAEVTSYSDTTAAEATAYVYRIRAGRDAMNSAWSNSSTAVTTLPAGATSLVVTTPTNTRAVLTWTDNSSGETGFKIQRSTDGGTTWTTINTTLPNATTYSDNTVSEGGSYKYHVVAFNAAGDAISSNTGTAATPPANPTGLSGSAANPNRIDLSWIDHSSHENGFYVERSSNGGASWSVVQTLDPDVTSWSDTSVDEAKNYQYRVRAFGDGGNSGYTSSVSVTTPIIAPTSLTATTVSATRVDLAWTDNSNAESQFKVERSADGGTTWSVIATVTANTQAYSDTTALEGRTYQYRVRAAKTGNTSAYTSVQSATTLPAAPTSLTVTVASDTQVNLTWTDNSAGETGFVVERSVDGGTTWTQIATPAANATSYSDTAATEGSAYTYRVKAVNAGGPSTYATSSSVTTLPAAPTSLAATSPSADTVELTWTDNSAHETGYKVERSDDGGTTWTQIATPAAGATSYTDTTVEEGTAYQYRVRANLASANSAYSNTQSVTTVPLAPMTLTATTVSATQIDLAWDDNSNGETSYKVERSEDGGLTFTQIVSLPAGTTSYSDTSVTEGLPYQYRVRAANAGGNSGYSPSADALTLPGDPSGLTATAISDTEVDLVWTDNSVGEEGFILERETDGSGIWDQIDTLYPDSNSYADLTVTGGHTYTYRLRAFNSAGESNNSNTDSATTLVP